MNFRSVLLVVGGFLVLIGAASFITGWFLSPFLYTAGAVLFDISQLTERHEGGNIIIRRLHRQQIFGALMLMVTAFFMFTSKHNEWIACLAIAAFLELYTSFRISHEEKKEKEK